jgi:hypothetical protein
VRERGSILEGKYRILREAGRGKASVVYLAQDVRLGKNWALKEIFPDRLPEGQSVKGVFSEVRLLKRLDHPAFPRIVDIFRTENSIIIVMDFIEGVTLDRILAERGPQSEKRVIGWALQICGMLDYLHHLSPPVIYRDLKPANLILKKNGQINIIDFNAARIWKPEADRDTEPLGTRGYAPPEQYGISQTDARSDLYALGKTIKRLSGDRASPGLSEIIRRSTTEAPEDRYRSAAEMAADLRHPDRLTESFRKEKRHRIQILLFSLSLSAVFFLGGIFFRALSIFTIEEIYKQKSVRSRTMSFSEQEETYYQAISLEPGRADAYLALLELYENRDEMTEEQSLRFRSCVLGHREALGIAVQKRDEKEKVQRTVSPEVCRILLRAGLLEYYAHPGGTRAGALAAESYFEILSSLPESTDKDRQAIIREAGEYYRICRFTAEFGSDLGRMTDPDPASCGALFESVRKCVESAENTELSDYARCRLFLELTGLLSQYRAGIRDTGIPKEDFCSVLQKILSQTASMRAVSEKSRESLENLRTNVERCLEETEYLYGSRERSGTG